MTKEQYDVISAINPETTLQDIVKLLKNQDDRTLLYGYTVARYTVHIYLKDGSVYGVAYKRYDITDSGGIIIDTSSIANIIPSKRTYPECSDYEFCMLLKKAGYYVSYTTYDDNHTMREGPFIGFTIEELEIS